jgi:CDP-diacylglycerol--glycerol-3-phosphate 3-phosphatidyltransferase
LLIPVFVWCVRAADPASLGWGQDASLEGVVPPGQRSHPHLWGWFAGLLFAVAAGSDVLDGPLARRAGAASNAGRFFDHFADIGFILIALSTYVALGVAPWWVPASIALSFGFYVTDSLRRSSRAPSLIGSRLGHFGGIANYVLIGVLVFNHSAGIGWLPGWLMMMLFALVPIYSLGAMAARLASR